MTLYQFDKSGERLEFFISSDNAVWKDGMITFPNGSQIYTLSNGKVEFTINKENIAEQNNPFKVGSEISSHLSSSQLKEKIKNSNSETERTNYSIALQKRYAAFFLPLVVVLFTAPFAISISRQGSVSAIAYAIALWLLFTGVLSVFEQMAENGLISPIITVWSPIFIFSIIGMILVSKIKT